MALSAALLSLMLFQVILARQYSSWFKGLMFSFWWIFLLDIRSYHLMLRAQRRAVLWMPWSFFMLVIDAVCSGTGGYVRCVNTRALTNCSFLSVGRQ